MATDDRERLVLPLDDDGAANVSAVGGKGANLHVLRRMEGVEVPLGFCVTTAAYDRLRGDLPAIDDLTGELARLADGERHARAELGAELRQTIEAAPIPISVAEAIIAELARHDEATTWAVRSSATAEDQPTASFAGQHDSSLHVVGADAVLDAVRRCWASLHTDRAIAYRRHHGIDHRTARMAVVVQQQVDAAASGVMFTADPMTSDRTVVVIEACSGLADALVSGAVEPEVHRVRADRPVVATLPAEGGTRSALTEHDAVRLAALGRRIESHLGAPQDIEWCLSGGTISVVQSRPITTVFPIPDAGDDEHHVYVSVGHQQMMTDAMTPLGLSFWLAISPAAMVEAGSRLFVDVTARLASPATRDGLLDAMQASDPLIGAALRTVVERDDFLPPAPDAPPASPPWAGPPPQIPTDPALVRDLVATWERSLAAARAEIEGRSGTDLLDAIAADIEALRALLFEPRSIQVIMAALESSRWLNEHLHEWLGERNVADALTQSAPDNVTSEMGLALLDVADAIRPHREVVAHLERTRTHDGALDELAGLPGGGEALAAIEGFLQRFGMRCIGEIDIARPRWSERPEALVPVLVGHLRSFEPGEAERRLRRGRDTAAEAQRDLLSRLRALPDGDRKASDTEAAIARLRTFIGYREYPKYAWMCRYLVYKRAIIAEGHRLVQSGAIDEVEDIHLLTIAELRDAVRTGRADRTAIAARRAALRSHESLTPPRVLTSDGEAVTATYDRADLPPGALPGLAVSSGIVEGRARVVLDLDDLDVDIEPGDILVTAHTDPSWSPLFVLIGGLVTEVGGLMTHGAVVAREYGLPAVVGVVDATRRIVDGQRIRVDGSAGHVELLPG